MARCIGPILVAALAAGLAGPARAGDDAKAVLDKAIKALGGEEKLSKPKGFTWKTKGTIHIMGSDNAFTGKVTVQGLDHFRSEVDGEFGGNKIMIATVLAGDKGWRKFG